MRTIRIKSNEFKEYSYVLNDIFLLNNFFKNKNTEEQFNIVKI